MLNDADNCVVNSNNSVVLLVNNGFISLMIT